VNTTVSPQIRIVALVGLVAVLGLGASMFVFGRGGSKTETIAVSTSAATTTAAVTTAATHTTPAKPVTKPHVTPAKPRHVTKPHVVKAKPKPKPSPGFRGYPVYSNLPRALQWQLAHHKVVVVSIYNSRSDVDAISVAEAHQGAVDAKVGFLLVDVLDNRVAGLLTALLPGGGLLPDPGVLVYRAPGDIALRLDGFNDRSAVAQAALNALNGETGPVTDTTAAATTPAVVTPPPASGSASEATTG
jgi:hypothetical protein